MRNFTFFISFIYLLSFGLHLQSNGQDLETDSLALVALYNECNGTNWTGFDTWLNGPLATWEDVTVSWVKNEAGTDSTQRVTHVEFSNMTLTGSLPEELGDLTEMSGKIQIHHQPGLTGTFPAFIWNWTKVERMQIKWCGFTDIDVTGIENMVNLYEFNTQETPFEGEIPVEIFELPLMRDVYLEDGMWTSLPADLPIPTPTPLRRFYINGNQFTDFPDLTGMVWAEGAKIKIRNNYLTFEDIVPNMWIADDSNVSAFEYSPQEVIGEDMITYADAGTEVTLESGIGGTATTVYTWIKGEDQVGDTKDLTIASFDPATQTGTYYCIGQDTEAPGLDIMSAKKMIFENATIQDSLSLVALYEECGGADWTGFDTWLNGPLATWEDVTVSWVKNEAGTDSTQRVTHVNFKNMTLTGTLPEELGNMTEMSGKIEIHNQPGLTGTFPAFIWNWTKVERMQIKWCGFTDIDVTGIENMVNLYEFNTQETPFEGVIPVEIFKLPLMRDVYLEDGKWTALPEEMPIPTPTPLRRFYINGNMFTDLPDLTGMVWAEGAKIKIRNNYLTFEDIVPNMWIASDANVSAFEYSPQETIGEESMVYADAGSEVTFNSGIGGTETTVYTWLLNGEIVEGADSSALVISSFDPAAQSGTYQCVGQDTEAPGLDIMSANKMLYENATAQDSLALVSLYEECGGADWTGFDTWLNGPLATWEAVTVSWVKNEAGTDSTQRVTHVDFKNMTLIGTLPEELGNMREMSGKIEIHNQPGLTGTFPAFIWNWTKVERMQIKWCGFTDIDVTGIEKMVNLYEFNTQETPFEGVIPAEIFELPLMRDVYMEDGKWTALPEDMPIPTPTPLRRFYINGNMFTDLPDLTGMVWAEGAKIKIRDNYLTFEDIIPNMWIADDANVEAFEYSPQGMLTEKDTIMLVEGDSLELTVVAGGTGNIYTWLKDGEVVEGADSDTLYIESTLKENSGEYQCIVQNVLVPGLDLMTDTFSVMVNYPVNAQITEESYLRVNGNPVRDILSIDSDKTVETVAIYDIMGRLSRIAEVNSNTVRVNVQDLKNGIYFVRLKSNSSNTVLKIVKE